MNRECVHKWGWSSVTSFIGGRSGMYAHCSTCDAEDWEILDRLKSEMPPAIFKPGDTVIYREERWRYDVTGNIRLDLVKATDYDAIVQDSFANPSGGGLLGQFGSPLEYRYSILCKDGERLFERSPLAEDLTLSNHGGTVAAWRAAEPKPTPYKLEDDDPALIEPRLRCIGITFERGHHSFRCTQCRKLQPNNTPLAYVRDYVHIGDDWRALVENYQQRPWGGSGCGWCPKCAHKLLPFWSTAYWRFKLTGEFPLQKYIQSDCDDCHQPVNAYYYRNIGEDMWEVYCRECQYARQSHDLFEGGFGYTFGQMTASLGALNPGESVTVTV